MPVDYTVQLQCDNRGGEEGMGRVFELSGGYKRQLGVSIYFFSSSRPSVNGKNGWNREITEPADAD